MTSGKKGYGIDVDESWGRERGRWCTTGGGESESYDARDEGLERKKLGLGFLMEYDLLLKH